MKSTITQVLKEFWFPFVLALAWMIYSLQTGPMSIQRAVTVFGTAFFLISWMTGQVVRVQRQEGVRSGLSAVERRLEASAHRLNEVADQLTKTITGGDSFCSYSPDFRPGGMWTLHNGGKFPLYDVSARVCDLDKFDVSNPFAADQFVQIGEMPPEMASMVPALQFGSDSQKNANIFFSARNGAFAQMIKARHIDGRWCVASMVFRSGSGKPPIYSDVDDGYPRNAAGNPIGFPLRDGVAMEL